MWPDNETDIDLLGFDFLVDELLVLLRDPNVLPVTIGIAGDWGSGKSSILKMAGKALAEEGAGKFAVVEFSPWRFEDYEDVKAALLEAVLGAVKGNVSAVTDEARKAKLAKLLKRLVLRVKWLPAMRMAAAAALKGHTDLTPEQIGLLSNPLITAGLEAKQQEALAKLEAEGKAPEEPVTLGEFRETFAELMTDLDVQALVVLVDDLDRCLPNTIIDVFEAMRLFLHAPKTAFVVAADQRMVEAAVKHAYPDAVAADTSVATDYLEKILQVTISVPPLSAAESETYASLLMAQANTSPEQFNQLARAAKAERAKASLSVAMNHGIAEAALDTMPDGLADALAIAGRISPVLAPKQRGNPRQIKRFLNLFELRRGAASRREVDLDPAVLAKLMVLEAIASAAYHKLFLWQAQSAGKPPELERAEASVGDPSVELALEVKEWLELAGVADWVPLEPPLRDVDLGPYFFYSRDRFTPALPAARLTPELQALLAELRSENETTRTGAVARALALDPVDLDAVYPQVLALASRTPAASIMRSSYEIASASPSSQPAFKEMLMGLPTSSAPKSLPMALKVAFAGVDGPVVKDVFDAWERDKNLGTPVLDARKPVGKKA
jgi:hypothetical protein